MANEQKRWICFARPASTGRTCYHLNEHGIQGPGYSGSKILCCEKCGATKSTGDHRREKLDLDKTEDLIAAAALASDLFGDDELEEFAAQQRRRRA